MPKVVYNNNKVKLVFNNGTIAIIKTYGLGFHLVRNNQILNYPLLTNIKHNDYKNKDGNDMFCFFEYFEFLVGFKYGDDGNIDTNILYQVKKDNIFLIKDNTNINLNIIENL